MNIQETRLAIEIVESQLQHAKQHGQPETAVQMLEEALRRHRANVAQLLKAIAHEDKPVFFIGDFSYGTYIATRRNATATAGESKALRMN